MIHIVLFEPKASSTSEEWDRLRDDILALRETIDGITRIAWGPNVSPEGLSQGFTEGFVMEFVDEGARDAYLPHPAHEAVFPLIDRLVERTLVYDMV